MSKNVSFLTLGCAKNESDSARMQEDLIQAGYSIVDIADSADIIVVNTCSFIQSAIEESLDAVFEIAGYDSVASGDTKLVVCGCMPSRFGNDLEEELTEADKFVTCREEDNIVEIIDDLLGVSSVRNSVEVDFDYAPSEYVKISDGCNRFCSYCIIPYARGRVRSKPLDDLIAEVTQLSEKGYKEIVLTGINLSAFGQDINLHLCDAVEAVCAINGIERVRLGSLEPEQLSEDVIIRLSKQQKLCPQFHLSLQSGCDETLKRMNRHYTTEEYRTIVQNLRNAFDNAAITTDIMVGFPGETEEEFMQSLEFAKEISFSKVHVFAYSQRPGTKACNAPNQITKKVKEIRSKQMMHVTNQTKQAFLNQQCGTIQDVLVEREISTNLYEGYTTNYTPVQFHSDKNLCGQLVAVHITKANENDCYGIPTTA